MARKRFNSIASILMIGLSCWLLYYCNDTFNSHPGLALNPHPVIIFAMFGAVACAQISIKLVASKWVNLFVGSGLFIYGLLACAQGDSLPYTLLIPYAGVSILAEKPSLMGERWKLSYFRMMGCIWGLVLTYLVLLMTMHLIMRSIRHQA